MSQSDQAFITELVKRNRYLTLATQQNGVPWIATLEYIYDDSLNLYFFSPGSALHCLHIQANPSVCVSIFDHNQPDYDSAALMRLSGVQISGNAKQLEAPYPMLVQNQIDSWQLAMPPYSAYQIEPFEWYIPVLRDGVNERLKVGVR